MKELRLAGFLRFISNLPSFLFSPTSFPVVWLSSLSAHGNPLFGIQD